MEFMAGFITQQMKEIIDVIQVISVTDAVRTDEVRTDDEDLITLINMITMLDTIDHIYADIAADQN